MNPCCGNRKKNNLVIPILTNSDWSAALPVTEDLAGKGCHLICKKQHSVSIVVEGKSWLSSSQPVWRTHKKGNAGWVLSFIAIRCYHLNRQRNGSPACSLSRCSKMWWSHRLWIQLPQGVSLGGAGLDNPQSPFQLCCSRAIIVTIKLSQEGVNQSEIEPNLFVWFFFKNQTWAQKQPKACEKEREGANYSKRQASALPQTP